MPALLTDADGVQITVDLGSIRMGYWMLLHGYAPPQGMRQRKFPLTFKALLLDCPQAKADYALYLEGLHFYRQNRRPQCFGRPEKPVFPVSDRGMLPTPPAGLKTTVEQTPHGARFMAADVAGTMVYEVRGDRGCLDGISATWNNAVPFSPAPAAESSMRKAIPSPRRCCPAGLDGQRLKTRWQTAAGRRFQADYSLQGLSLVVDLSPRAAGRRARPSEKSPACRASRRLKFRI